MEYLMTYGWAILIVAVALAAMFELGLFNSSSFAPNAPPGSCQVFRNAAGASVEGVCNELPQYVAQFNNGYVLIPNPSENDGFPNGYTMSAWVDYVNPETECGYAVGMEDSSAQPRGGAVLSCTNAAQPYGETIDKNGYNQYAPVPADKQVEPYNTWVFITVSWNPGNDTIAFYVNGTLEGSVMTDYVYSSNMLMANTPYYVIGGQPGGSSWNGEEADAQIYNTSLTASDVHALYAEGLGGAPIDPYHIVAWWPLNGNFNDYSGDANDGQAYGGVSFISSYAAPSA